MMPRHRVVLYSFVLSCTVFPLEAQFSPAESSRIPESQAARRKVTFVLMDSFPAPNVLAMIVRNPGAQESDFVAVKRSALDSKLVIQSLRSVGVSVARQGEHPQKRVTMFIMANIRLRTPGDADRTRTENIAQRLLVADERQVPGFGRRRAITTER